eukprot:403355552
MDKKRYIKNDYLDNSLDSNQAYPAIQENLFKLFREYEEKFDVISQLRLYSDGLTKIDTSLYIGSGGVVYTYFKLFEYFSEMKSQENINTQEFEGLVKSTQEKFEQSLDINIKLVEHGKCKKGLECPSYFMSVAGLFTTGLMYYKKLGDQDQMETMVGKILKHFEYFENDLGYYVEDEVLYGISGYLYSLLMILTEFDKNHKQTIQLCKRLIDVIIKDGKKWSKNQDFILIKWPRDRHENKFYLGGAHGLMGVLQMLLQAVNIIPDLQSDKNLMSVLKNSCDYLLDLQFESGNFPSSLGKKDDLLVHFCHGSTGAVPFIISAYKTFGDKIYLDALIKTAELIWERGLLKKGNGICHGISGNGLALHSMYRFMNDDLWLERSVHFGLATFDEDIQKIVAEYDDPGRMKVGIPDTPYSLMEGLGGQIVFYCELLRKDKKLVRFPGYEILY